jgi:transcriptional regulator with XRE-family HTH domain
MHALRSTSTDMESPRSQCERISVAGIDDPFAVGRRIREKREERGVSQADLARAIGATPHTVWRYETQGMTPSAGRIGAIAEALGVSERFLTTGADAETSVEHDESVRTALTELLGDWDPELHGPPPDEDEVRWLGKEIDFRQDRRAGLEITPRLLLDRLKERRRQQRGRAVERPKLAPPPPRPGTRKLSDKRKKR